MKENSNNITTWKKLWYSWKQEYRFTFADPAVIFSFLIISTIVAFTYTYIYSNQVLQELPIAMVDKDQTTGSRKFIRMLNASKQLKVAHHATNLGSAQKLMQEGKAIGILIIPENFSKSILKEKQPAVSIYADASAMLYYKEFFKAVKITSAYMNAGIEINKLTARGATTDEALQLRQPVQAKVVELYNPNSGYGSFVMPPVYLIIIQTTLLTGIGLLGGTFRERKKYVNEHTEIHNIGDAIAIVLGKAGAYLSFGLFTLTVILGFVIPLFGMPQRGNILDIYLLSLPFILAISFLGLTLNVFFKHREDAVMTIIFTSIPALLICGVSWPIQEIPPLLLAIGKLIPTTITTQGFVAISQTGISLTEVSDIWMQLWVLCAFYFMLALFSMKRLLK